MNALVDFTLRDLTRNELAVWVVLWRDTDATSNTAEPSCASIAERAGCSVRHVKRVVKKLVARGLLRVVRQGGINRGTSVYRVLPGDG